MKKLWKQLEAWVTDLTQDIFLWARLKLTILYILISYLIILLFSGALFYTVVQNIRYNLEGNFIDEQTQEILLNNAMDDIEQVMFFATFIILLFVAALSYILAGKTLRPIKRAMEIQKQFAQDASHDLRTPLAIMKAESEILLKKKQFLQSSVQKTIKSNLEEIDKMSHIVENLLTLARTEDGPPVKTLGIINLSELVSGLVQKMTFLAENKAVKIKITKEAEGLIKGDLRSIERVIQNMVQNALNHTKPGGSIAVFVQESKDKAILIIQDTGTGINKKDLPHIFERFYRSQSSPKTGEGLGLSITKKIIEHHRGTIEIESVKGQGTTVRLSFPAASRLLGHEKISI